MTLFKVKIIGKFNVLGQWQPEMSRMGFLEEVADETAIERKVCTQSQ